MPWSSARAARRDLIDLRGQSFHSAHGPTNPAAQRPPYPRSFVHLPQICHKSHPHCAANGFRFKVGRTTGATLSPPGRLAGTLAILISTNSGLARPMRVRSPDIFHRSQKLTGRHTGGASAKRIGVRIVGGSGREMDSRRPWSAPPVTGAIIHPARAVKTGAPACVLAVRPALAPA